MLKAKEKKQGRFNMNLQLFSDSQPSQADLNAQARAMLEGGSNSSEGVAPQGQPQPTEGSPQNSPQEGGQVPVEGQQPNQVPTEGQPNQAPQDALLLGKFKSPEEMANGYVNVERAFSQKAQEAATLQQQLQAAQQQMAQMQQQIQSVVNPQQQQPQPTPEELNEQVMNKFYENPSQFFNEIKEQAKAELMQQIAPIQQQYQAQQQQQAMSQAIAEFQQGTPDFQTFSPVMGEILAQNPELNAHPGGPKAALNIAYQMAKGQQYKDPNSLLQDQNFVKQNILSNEDIKNQVIQEYLQGLKQGNQAPTLISGQANGQTVVMPQNQPQTIQEARQIALERLRG